MRNGLNPSKLLPKITDDIETRILPDGLRCLEVQLSWVAIPGPRVVRAALKAICGILSLPQVSLLYIILSLFLTAIYALVVQIIALQQLISHFLNLVM